MRLALIGDIHLYRLLATPWHLMGKALLGQLHLWLRRGWRFDPRLLEPLVRRAGDLKPDMLLLSGDFTTTAKPGEFADAAGALSPLMRHVPTIAVPGNHDCYTFTAGRQRRIARYFGEVLPESFPHLRHLGGRWHLLALDAAVPRAFSSRGRVGADQLTRAAALVSTLDADDGLIVLCHYALRELPDHKPMKWDHRLEDAAGVADLLARFTGRTLYLHGHVHRPWCWPRCEQGLDHVVDVNAGAPLLRTRAYPFGQGFWQIELPNDPGAEGELIHHRPEDQAGGETGWRTDTYHF